HWGRGLLKGLMHSLDQVSMFSVAIDYVGHDKHIETCCTWRKIGEDCIRWASPFIAIDMKARAERNLRRRGYSIAAHVVNQVGIRIVGHHNRSCPSEGTYNARHACSSANLQNVLALNEL